MITFDVPRGSAHAELIVKRSRFIAGATSIVSRETAEAEIFAVRETYPDASHVVYAFIFGTANSQTFGMSDDGEPRNTAGRPVLEVLKGSGLTNCLVTVTRYFGGTKLGTGGLVHAYSDAAKAVLADLPRERLVERRTCTFSLPYDQYEILRQELPGYEGVRVLSEDFTEEVTLSLAVPEDLGVLFTDRLRDLSRGVVEIGECFT